MFFLFWSSFVVTLSGAVMPGPLLTATIGESMKRGFRAGPLLVLGHAILEMLLLIALAAGLGAWLQRKDVMGALGLIGGGVLVAMGIQMAVTSRSAVQAAGDIRALPAASPRGPVAMGIVMSLSNPYWTLWWATVGLTLVSRALRLGVAGLGTFYMGHILSDLAWYSLVSGAVAGGRRFCPAPVHRAIIVGCGAALVGLGGYFFYKGYGLTGSLL